ncbi:MAG: DNA repair protein RadC [Treponema sp.]|nr:DNA repair protein RadC [Treponema sp.]
METNLTNKKLDLREMALEHGMSFPFDEDLVALILGSGSKEFPIQSMARKIVETLDNSNEKDIVRNLLSVKGIGSSKALAIAAALELGKRRSNHLRAPIRTPEDMIPFIKNFAVSNKERFVVVTLNGGHEIIQIHVVSVGTLNRSLIHPREVFSEAIRENAAAMILCHNHPSGNVEPSEEDIQTTKILLKASIILGIDILDHIIVDREKYYSFVEHNLLFTNDE